MKPPASPPVAITAIAFLCLPAIGQPNPQNTCGGSDALVTIISPEYRGYDVYVDEIYVGTDGKGGDALDGVYSSCVTGNQVHRIRVNHPLNWKWWEFFFMAGGSYPFNF